MGTGGMNFIHNAYDIYQKPEIQIPLQTAKLGYQIYKIAELATHERCYMCDDLYYPKNGDNLCYNCRYKY